MILAVFGFAMVVLGVFGAVRHPMTYGDFGLMVAGILVFCLGVWG